MMAIATPPFFADFNAASPVGGEPIDIVGSPDAICEKIAMRSMA
jgi:hypothetical protein